MIDNVNPRFLQHLNEHQRLVAVGLQRATDELHYRLLTHDTSKIDNPAELAAFSEHFDALQTAKFGTPEYDVAVAGLGVGLAEHYAENSHHPEHFSGGILDMSLLDLIEMLADWAAAAKQKGVSIDWEHQQKRYNVSDELLTMLQRTASDLKLQDLSR